MNKKQALERARKYYASNEKLREHALGAADYGMQVAVIVKDEGIAVAKAMVLVDPLLKNRVLCRRKTSNIGKENQLCNHINYEYVLDEPDNAVHIQMFGL